MLEESQNAIWLKVQEYLGSTLSEIEYEWVSPLICAGFADKEIILNMPVKLYAEKVSKKYTQTIVEAVCKVTGQTVAVSVFCEAETSKPEATVKAETESETPKATLI